MKRTIRQEAVDRRMTLVELRQFLAAIDGAPDDTPVKVRTTIGGWLRSIEVREEP